MLNHLLPPDTQAILLLCASFGESRSNYPNPLTIKEYNLLAKWLRENDLTPKDLLTSPLKDRLLQIEIEKLDTSRLSALLERGMMLSLSVEKWTNQGLWILGRSDEQYPKCLKEKLKTLAPPVIYGVGQIDLLFAGGLAVVGSRNVDEEAINYTTRVAQTCSQENIQVISGGARGIDQTAMLSALESGGKVVAVLADSLAKSSVFKAYRQSIQDGQLTLISSYDPFASFNVGNAMGRNKYIYALSNYALVISSDLEKGGTWSGALEALEKYRNTPVFIRVEGSIPEGNKQLIKKGALPFPETPWNAPLISLLNPLISDKNLSKQEDITLGKLHLNVDNTLESTSDIYEIILPIILTRLKQINYPESAKYIAEIFNVRKIQMEDWLNRACEEGKIKKNKKPVTYEVVNVENHLFTLFR